MYFTKLIRRPAFTLIELLVVVAIIGLLVSILLPSLNCAREQAKGAKCGAQLRAIGNGMAIYFAEHEDWIPGVNTTGATWVAKVLSLTGQERIAYMRKDRTPVQNYDWMSPVIGQEGSLGLSRAERFDALVNKFGCPSQRTLNVDLLWPEGLPASNVPDRSDFNQFLQRSNYRPLSYLMPVHFQYWGQAHRGAVIVAGQAGTSAPTISAEVAPSGWEVLAEDYRSRMDKVGAASDKVAVADGMRYMQARADGNRVDFDVSFRAGLFGSFTSAGAWWSGSTEYGVRAGSKNWDDQTVTVSNLADGKALSLSYRHTCDRASAPDEVKQNKGSINALHFDGHIERLGDRASREIAMWYPKGSKVKKPNEGMTMVEAKAEIP